LCCCPGLHLRPQLASRPTTERSSSDVRHALSTALPHHPIVPSCLALKRARLRRVPEWACWPRSEPARPAARDDSTSRIVHGRVVDGACQLPASVLLGKSEQKKSDCACVLVVQASRRGVWLALQQPVSQCACSATGAVQVRTLPSSIQQPLEYTHSAVIPIQMACHAAAVSCSAGTP
jgi:hypothetical protein